MEVPLEDTKLYGICIPKKDSSKPVVELKVEKPNQIPPSSVISGISDQK